MHTKFKDFVEGPVKIKQGNSDPVIKTQFTRVREDNCPALINVVMQLDRPLGGIGLNIGYHIAQREPRHDESKSETSCKQSIQQKCTDTAEAAGSIPASLYAAYKVI